MSQDHCDNLNLLRDRLCKALQDRGTSPGLEGSSDSRSARVSSLGSKFAILVSKVSKESDVYSIRLSSYCKPSTTEVSSYSRYSPPAQCAFAGHQSNGAVLFEEEE